VVRSLRANPHVLTGVYAVNAIDDDAERGRFEHHMRRCQDCAAEVRGMAETATRLAFAAAEPAPPQLRDRVLTAVSRTRQLPPLVDGQRQAEGRRDTAEPRTAREPRPRPRLAWVVAAVALIAAVALTVTLVQTRLQLDRARARQASINAVLAAPDARAISQATSVGGTATVVYSRSRGALVVTSAQLPAPPSGKVYELWLLGPPKVRPEGFLRPAGNGRSAPVLVPGLVAGDQLGLTVEPAGGTQRPTTTPILVLPLRL
jgi:anti-sigma-K factor RskA